VTAAARRPLLIDCDPGVDDSVALLLACASPELDLIGVTTVAGNVGLDLTTWNALRILTLAGRADIPVAAGAVRPLIRGATGRATHVHGNDGVGLVRLPEPVVSANGQHAVDLMAKLVQGSATPVTLVAIGPLTNVALFFARHPAEAARLERLVVLGGSAGAGNYTPAAEFNIWTDPEAAYRVLTDPGLPTVVPTTLIGLDVTLRTLIGRHGVGRLMAGGPVSQVAGELVMSVIGIEATEDSAAVHDAVAVAEASQPGLLTAVPARVLVDCSDGPERGRTIVDLHSADPHMTVALDPNMSISDLIVTRLVDGYSGVTGPFG
jgi:pyrimidine-specific ribonucleoside hydrolase